MTSERELALKAKAWPFEEARKLLARYSAKPPEKGYVLLETGYGPSGLPHIGTFGEVVRTTMVRQAFQRMSDIPTRLFAFSDDMDGLRKVPGNVPNQEMLQRASRHGRSPLVPDPFGKFESFGHHNNAMLRGFLDGFGFEYEFQSSTDWYKSGRFDQALLKVLQHYDEVMAIMLPTPRRRAAADLQPLPADFARRPAACCMVPIIERKPRPAPSSTRTKTATLTETPVTGGRCKLQWKPDWAMRWYALGVDYEMSGKDLIASVEVAGKICRVLGAKPPEGFNYELFLDEKAQKISKSKGNGLSVEEWLTYGPAESLSLFMYQKPRAAKRLYFDVIPRAVDDYLSFRDAFPKEDAAKQMENPLWHIHNGKPPYEDAHLAFNILLNLASVCNSEDKAVLWGFISRYAPKASPQATPFLDKLVGYAVAYYRDFVKPEKKYRAATEMERAAFEDLLRELEKLPVDAPAEDIQFQVYEVGKRHAFADLKAWFQSLYEVLFGTSQGPRMGTFIALYGIKETIALIKRALAGEMVGG